MVAVVTLTVTVTLTLKLTTRLPAAAQRLLTLLVLVRLHLERGAVPYADQIGAPALQVLQAQWANLYRGRTSTVAASP